MKTHNSNDTEVLPSLMRLEARAKARRALDLFWFTVCAVIVVLAGLLFFAVFWLHL